MGRILIFTILILLIHEHGIFLHLFVLPLLSFMSVLSFSIYRSFVSLGRFIPKYFSTKNCAFLFFPGPVYHIASLALRKVFQGASSWKILERRNAQQGTKA